MSWNWTMSRRLSDVWIGRCRDEAGRRGKLLVVLTRENRVALVLPPGEVAVLDLITVGQLRAVLREAVFALDDPTIESPYAFPVPIAGFHLDCPTERRQRSRWRSRLFCHRTRLTDVARSAAEQQTVSTYAGVQRPTNADLAGQGVVAPTSVSANAQNVHGRRSA